MKKRILSFILSSVMALTIVGATPAMVEAAWSQEQYYRESIEAYDGFDYSDPQFIPDEEFFGVWDEETGDWKENYIPYLYYEEYPGLSKVEEPPNQGITKPARKKFSNITVKRAALIIWVIRDGASFLTVTVQELKWHFLI